MVPPAHNSERYDPVLIGLHWLTVAFIVAAVCLIWTTGSLPKGALKTDLFFLHRSCGLAVFALTVFRLAWRSTHAVPPPPDSVAAWQQTVGRLTHWLLYALMLVMPVTGFVSSAALGHPVSVFFLFDLPPLPVNKPLAQLCGGTHETLQWALYVLVSVHAVAALGHHFVLGDGVLRRMLPSGHSNAPKRGGLDPAPRRG